MDLPLGTYLDLKKGMGFAFKIIYGLMYALKPCLICLTNELETSFKLHLS
jgi:hypothetical protein